MKILHQRYDFFFKKLEVFVESTFVRDFMLYFLVKKHQIACNRYSYVIYLYVE